jgi:hypothetical protein
MNTSTASPYSNLSMEDLHRTLEQSQARLEALKNPPWWRKLALRATETASAAAGFVASWWAADRLMIDRQRAQFEDALETAVARTASDEASTPNTASVFPLQDKVHIWPGCSAGCGGGCPGGMGGRCGPTEITIHHNLTKDEQGRLQPEDCGCPETDVRVTQAGVAYPAKLRFDGDKRWIDIKDAQGQGPSYLLATGWNLDVHRQQLAQMAGVDVSAIDDAVLAQKATAFIAQDVAPRPQEASHEGVKRAAQVMASQSAAKALLASGVAGSLFAVSRRLGQGKVDEEIHALKHAVIDLKCEIEKRHLGDAASVPEPQAKAA